jgi:hypothetical protein
MNVSQATLQNVARTLKSEGDAAALQQKIAAGGTDLGALEKSTGLPAGDLKALLQLDKSDLGKVFAEALKLSKQLAGAGADGTSGGARDVALAAGKAPSRAGSMQMLIGGGGSVMPRDQIFSTISNAKTAEDIVKMQGKYGAIASSYASVTANEFFESPAAKGLTPKQQTAVRQAFAELTKQVSSHFTPEGIKNVADPKMREMALGQHANYVAGELNRAFPKLTQEFVRTAVIEHFKTGGDIEKLASKLEGAGGPGLDYFKDNGWMVGNGFDAEKKTWSHWGFGDLDVALNLPGVYGGEATRKFAESLAPGGGDALLHDALNKDFWARTPSEAAVVEFCMRSSQAGWLVSKLGRGIVEANNPKKAANAHKHFAHHDVMTFDQLKANKGWSEMVKDIDQTRGFAVQTGIIAAKNAEPRPLEEAMLNVLSHGIFKKDGEGKLALSKHGETLRSYLKTEAYRAVAMPDFDQRNGVHAEAFAMQSAAQAAHATSLDGAVFPAFLQVFLKSGVDAGKEMDAGGGGASAAGLHALKGFMSFTEGAAPLIGQTRPSDIFRIVNDDLGFPALPIDGPALKKNWQELLDLGVIAGYGAERVNGDPAQKIDPASAETGKLGEKDRHAIDIGLRLANNTWGSGQVHRHFDEVQKKGKSDRLERGAYDLFDAHKLGTYTDAREQLEKKGIEGARGHELAVSVVAFEVYKDLFQLSDFLPQVQKNGG